MNGNTTSGSDLQDRSRLTVGRWSRRAEFWWECQTDEYGDYAFYADVGVLSLDIRDAEGTALDRCAKTIFDADKIVTEDQRQPYLLTVEGMPRMGEIQAVLESGRLPLFSVLPQRIAEHATSGELVLRKDQAEVLQRRIDDNQRPAAVSPKVPVSKGQQASLDPNMDIG